MMEKPSWPLVAIIPSYGRNAVLERCRRDVMEYIAPDGLCVLEQPLGEPMGSGAARRVLLTQALDYYCHTARDLAILSLDDDHSFPMGAEHGRQVRQAARLFAESSVEARIGIIQIPNTSAPKLKRTRPKAPSTHSFLLNSRMVAEGITYHPTEYGDDVALSLLAYFAGWRVVTSGIACLPHHTSARGRVSKMGGGLEAAYVAGRHAVEVRCELFPMWRDNGWVTYTEGERAGVMLPTPFTSVKVTKAGHLEHQRAYCQAIAGCKEKITISV